jgi:hypothetical protein
MTPETDLLPTLRRLELALHQPALRASAAGLAALLHPAFREFGRSGAVYTREAMLAHLPAGAEPAPAIWAQDFAVEPLGEGVALLTYRSAHVGPGGQLERHTNRASVWQLGADGRWQMRFHQGTPTAPFERGAL